MGLGEEDTNARARRRAPKGVADVGDTLLGNFLQGVSNVAREESDKKQSSSKVGKNGESRPKGEKTEHRQNGKEKRRRSRERLEGQTGSDRLQSKEKHKKKESKHTKTSREKKTTVNGHAAREDAAANQNMLARRDASTKLADTSSHVDSVFELAAGGLVKPAQQVAPDAQTRNGGAANGGKTETKEGKASRHRDRKRRRKQEEEAKEAKSGHAKNGQGPKEPSLSVEAAAITDDTADDILGSFLRKLLGGTGQTEPEKAPSTASAAAAGTSTSTPSRLSPSLPVSTTLPEIGDLLGGLEEEEREPSLVATESGSESVEHCLPVGHTISAESGMTDVGKQEQAVDTKAVQVAGSLEVSAPLVSSTVPAAAVANPEVAISSGYAAESDDSSDSYSSSSSSIASLRRRAQLVGSSPAPQVSTAPPPRSLESDSSSSSSSSSGASSASHFSELFPGESAATTDGVLSERSPRRVERFACAKMSVRSKLRCSCHFALLRSCPDRGDEAIGDEFCGSDE